MKNKIIFTSIVMGLIAISSCKSEKVMMNTLRDQKGYVHIKSAQDACYVYPHSIHEIQKRAAFVQQETMTIINAIIAIAPSDQNKENIIYALDRLTAYIPQELGILELVQQAFMDENVREQANKQALILQGFYTENIGNNVALFKAIETYAQNNAQKENLLSEERYLLEELIADYKREGINLPEDQRTELVTLKKEEQRLGQEFRKNISEDVSSITATAQELDGVEPDFLSALKTTESGLYIVLTDYPSSDMIMNYCKVQETRKRFSKAFKNRAYPANEKVLKDYLVVSDAIAKKLGFLSAADLDLSSQMIKSEKKAWAFLEDLKIRMVPKALAEFKELTSDLPEGITLTRFGKLQPWDSSYLSTYFEKHHYRVDEREIAKYFPMEQTIAGLINIYEQFFNLTITKSIPQKAWHPDVQLLEVADKESQEILGYIFLDMFPRPKKYSHAAEFPGIESFKQPDGNLYPATVTLVCNFTKPTTDKPSLLKFNEVNTFFHECGHALHSVLGKTRLACQSGTKVKHDFVELPSQMLENWLEDKSILKNLSCHYQTGEHMPDALLDQKLRALKFGLGIFGVRQLSLGMTSLACFSAETIKDADALMRKYTEELCPYVSYDEDTHSVYNFGHIASYRAKYYGYMWSDVLGSDVFSTIEKEGLLNPAAGKRYVDCIIGRGGSKDPNEMLVDYLGRQPNSDAFFKKMGI